MADVWREIGIIMDFPTEFKNLLPEEDREEIFNILSDLEEKGFNFCKMEKLYFICKKYNNLHYDFVKSIIDVYGGRIGLAAIEAFNERENATT
jgi:hypothetical protein